MESLRLHARSVGRLRKAWLPSRVLPGMPGIMLAIFVVGLFVGGPVFAETSVVGSWQGVIDLPGQLLDVRIVFAGDADGRVSGTVDIPAQGAYALPLKDIELDDNAQDSDARDSYAQDSDARDGNTSDRKRIAFAFVDIDASVEAVLIGDGEFEGTFHQAGMAFPIRAVRDEPVDETNEEIAYLLRFVGQYDMAGVPVDVALRDGVLVLTVPGQPPYVLAEREADHFVFRDHEGFAVVFEKDAGGAVVKATLVQPQGNVELIKR